MKQRILSTGQFETLNRFLTNAGTIILGGLVFGSFVGQQTFRWKTFVIGSCLYSIVLWLALLVSHEEGQS